MARFFITDWRRAVFAEPKFTSGQREYVLRLAEFATNKKDTVTVSNESLRIHVGGGSGSIRTVTRAMSAAEDYGYIKTLQRGGGSSPSVRQLVIPDHMKDHPSLQNKRPEFAGEGDSIEDTTVPNTPPIEDTRVTNANVYSGHHSHLLRTPQTALRTLESPIEDTSVTLSSCEVDEVDRSRGDNPSQFSHVEISPHLQDLVKKLRG